MYRVCYQMCTQRSPFNYSETLYARHGETFKNYLKNTVLPQLEKQSGHKLLSDLKRYWDNHNVMNKWMWKFFMYLVSAPPPPRPPRPLPLTLPAPPRTSTTWSTPTS